MLFVTGLMAYVLSISSLEKDGYIVLLQGGQVLLYLEGVTLDVVVVFGIKQG